jgi:signal recognition particle receptor subunit beta
LEFADKGRTYGMVFFNWATMQMAAKIVYYGPGLCGKTSNLSYIYAKTSPESRGEMVSLETESDRTLFFDLLPIEVGTIGGFKTRLQLYTVPGQVFYNTTRKLVLKGVDGLVFVADSQRPMRDANIESFQSLVDNLKEFGLTVSELPIVLQYNKRDLSNILTVDELNADLNPDGEFLFLEACAVNGDGVITTLKEITKLTLKKLKVRMAAPEEAAATPKISAPTVRPVKPPQPAPPISAKSLARAAEEGVTKNAQKAAAESVPEVVAAEPEVAEISPAAEPTIAEDEPAAVASDTEIPDFEEEPAATEEPPPSIGDEMPSETPEEEMAEAGDEVAGPAVSEEPAEVIEVAFDAESSTEEPSEPPRVKRVQVSNQMDILAELDGLRKQATMGSGGQRFESTAPDLDIDSLISGDTGRSRELRQKLEKSLNSDIFKTMRGMQIAIRIQDEVGETIHSFDPVSLDIEDATSLEKLCLRFSLDLENLP